MGSSPARKRKVFLSLVSWMNRSCSGCEPGRRHGALVVKGEPLLNPLHPGALGEIGEEGEVENQRSGEDRIAAEEVHLDLHRVCPIHPTISMLSHPSLLSPRGR